jgi:hypothetical protein
MASDIGSRKPVLRCSVIFRSELDGGRSQPLAAGALKSRQYRPHFVLGPLNQRYAQIGPGNTLIEQYHGVLIEDGPDQFAAGEEIEVKARLMFWDETRNSEYAGFTPGATFTVREGVRIVAHGQVLDID